MTAALSLWDECWRDLAAPEISPYTSPATLAFHHQHVRTVVRVLGQVPQGWVKPLKRTYVRIYQRDGLTAAEKFIAEVAGTIDRAAVTLNADDAEVCERARKKAGRVALAVAGKRAAEAYPIAAELTARSVTPASVDDAPGRTLAGCVARMKCERWWRRALRKLTARRVENCARKLDMVHRRAACYVSHEAVARRRLQNARNGNLLAEIEAVNDLGEAFTLAELASHSISNPALRRAELMTRIAGFEATAQARGDAAEFLTITCPSRYHSHDHKTGRRNPKYDGSTPRDAQDYLCRLWARARAALARAGIRAYGFRIAEPHHDGCPHWHLLLFVAADQADALAEILARYALADTPEECARNPAARIKRVSIDWARGSAAGYVAKYVSKNIDGANLGPDGDLISGLDGESAAERVAAWAATWGIRQFQQLGGPAVTIWRELRRVRDPLEGHIEAARAAADAGDWAGYCRAQGGVDAPRAAHPVTLLKLKLRVRLNRYGEMIAARVYGLQCGLLKVITRARSWSFSYRPAQRVAWSPVNNCTRARGGAPPPLAIVKG